MTNPNLPQDSAFYTLTLKKDPKVFPRIKDLVGVQQEVIASHLKNVEDTRDEELNEKFVIKNRFLEQQNLTGTQFYTTDVEREYGVDGLIPLEVIGYTEAKGAKTPMYAVCSLRMFSWPKDVDKDDQNIYLPINDLVVVHPVLCAKDYMLSEDKPDGIETFGFLDKKTKLYRIFERVDIVTHDLIPLVKDLGLKEFSKIIKFDKPVDLDEPKIDREEEIKKLIPDEEWEDDDIVDVEDPMAPGMEYVQMIKENPLYQYTKRLFIGFIEVFKENGLKMEPDVVNELYFMMFDTMLRTGVPYSTKVTLSLADIEKLKQVPD